MRSGSRLNTGRRVEAPAKKYGLAITAVLVLWDRTARSDRYRHAMVNPLMMDLMMSRVLQWRIRGRFVVHTVHEIIDQPKRVFNLFQDRLPYLVRIAENVPSYVYDEYADLRQRNP